MVESAGRLVPKTFIEHYVYWLTRQPLLVVAVVTLLTIYMMGPASEMEEHISSDLDIYLPEDTEATDILNELREDWSSDVVIIFVETDNRNNPYNSDTGEGSRDNITDRIILEEMSALEGDVNYRGLDWNKTDRGKEDDFIYAFSISVLVKELNSTPPRMAEASEKQAEDDIGISLSFDDSITAQGGEYSIPNQERVNEFINQTPSNALAKLVTDTNEDGIWDTAVIIFGITYESDDEELIQRINVAIDQRPLQRTIMTQTGILRVMHDMTEQATNDLNKTMPISGALVLIIVFLLQRNLRILVIAGVPVIFTLIWTFGLISLFNITLSPIIVAAAPILIALSVAYGLHLANRIAEFEHDVCPRVAVSDTLRTTGKAVLLSAVTTIIGFAALFIAIIVPMRIVGLTLVIGIGSAFVLTMLLVPNLVLLLRYRKRVMPGWQKIGEVPIKFRYPILAVAVVLTLISLSYTSVMTEPPDMRERQKSDIESLQKLYSYSDEFNAGQMAYILMKGDLYQTDTLDGIDAFEEYINIIPDARAMTIVDMFKSVAVNVSTCDYRDYPWLRDVPCPAFLEHNFVGTYWEFIHWLPNDESQLRAIKIFYDSLSDEMRGMLINARYDRTLMLVDLPFMGHTATERIVDAMNEVVDDRHWIPGGAVSHVTGMAAITLIIDDAVQHVQKWTMIISVMLVFITITLIYRSPRIGGISMIPILVVLAWQPLTMQGLTA